MSAEDWDFKEEHQNRKAENRAFNTEYIQLLTGIIDMEVEEITPYQLRIRKGKKRLDYFPTSSKATWVGSGKFFRIRNIELFLKENFKDK